MSPIPKKGESMSLESFFIPVKIEGVALVYARSKAEAEVILENTNVCVAGNKMCKNFELQQIGSIMSRNQFDNYGSKVKKGVKL